ncbi:hypothetical protein [Thermobifida cellulosilytica]|uniref:Uncharacterized protein n=1 Tax=Thermobifida cellulosilytica TB100 TaxID=665004 RepID=A0A147KKK5_THECS|nr:hypothetical protein [Thermobifida cellulosilytica]KUP97769.1 hypothetical protein AC529_04770 [Thermobifida cellulosilytica TB100]
MKPATPRPRPSSEKEEEEEEEKKTTNKKKRGDSETPRTKTPEDRAIRVVLDRLADHSPTEDEARAILTHIRTQATQRGTTIARIDKWIDGRDPGALAADLAHVRAQTKARRRPSEGTCRIHGDKRLPCIYCRMSAHAGDWTDLITELQRAGVEERPDLDALANTERNTSSPPNLGHHEKAAALHGCRPATTLETLRTWLRWPAGRWRM